MKRNEVSDKANRSFCLDSCMSAFFEYETPKVVTVQNVPLGILRLLLQILVISFVVFYQLWYAKGYQEFAEVEASVTTKVKGFSRYDRAFVTVRKADNEDFKFPLTK